MLAFVVPLSAIVGIPLYIRAEVVISLASVLMVKWGDRDVALITWSVYHAGIQFLNGAGFWVRVIARSKLPVRICYPKIS